MRRFLLVDDEAPILSALQRAIRRMKDGDEFEFEVFTNPLDAIKRSGEAPFDIVISDFRMPQMLGVDFLRIFKEVQPNTTRLLLTASTEFETIISAVNEAQVFKYLVKPWVNSELEENIGLALAHRDQILEDQRLANALRQSLDPLSAEQKEMRALEQEEPGITHVNWAPDGSVRLVDNE